MLVIYDECAYIDKQKQRLYKNRNPLYVFDNIRVLQCHPIYALFLFTTLNYNILLIGLNNNNNNNMHTQHTTRYKDDTH